MANARRGRNRDQDHKLRDESSSQFGHSQNRGTRGEGVRGNLADVAMEGGDVERTSTELTQDREDLGRGDDRLDEILGPDLNRRDDVDR